jgi:hypothetical protein
VTAPPALHGRFRGRVVTIWLESAGEDRRMKLHQDTDLVYETASGEVIPALPEMEFDGASIPPVFWILFGSPFTGKYRRAAVIHDTLCFVKDRPHREAHRVMYDACRALGVGRFRAWLIYRALLVGGSKW